MFSFVNKSFVPPLDLSYIKIEMVLRVKEILITFYHLFQSHQKILWVVVRSGKNAEEVSIKD